jgi:hypothetical protein
VINEDNFQKKFEALIERDRKKYIKPFMLSWDYQIKRKRIGMRYSSDLPNDFYKFNNKYEIINWINWFNGEYPNYIDDEKFDDLIKKSIAHDRQIMANYKLEINENLYKKIGLNNAHDFFIPQSYPVPQEFKIKNVLDFGAGCGMN